MSLRIIVKITKSLKYHLNWVLYKHVVYKEITHSFIWPVKEPNQPHKSILIIVSVTQHFITGFLNSGKTFMIFLSPWLVMDFFLSRSPELHPRALTSHPLRHSHPHRPCHSLQKWSQVCLLYGNLFAQAFVSPTGFPAGWDCLTHLRRGCESGCRIIFKANKTREEIPVKKSTAIRKAVLNEAFPPTVIIAPSCPAS